MRPGSHPLLLYTVDENGTPSPCNLRPPADAVRDIRHVYFASAMTQDFADRFPPSVALRLPANAALDFKVHYVNRAPLDLPGERSPTVRAVFFRCQCARPCSASRRTCTHVGRHVEQCH